MICYIIMLPLFTKDLLDDILQGKDVYTLFDQFKNNKEQIDESIKYLIFNTEKSFDKIVHIYGYIIKLTNLKNNNVIDNKDIINSDIPIYIKAEYLYLEVLNGNAVDINQIQDFIIPNIIKQLEDRNKRQVIYYKLYILYVSLQIKTNKYVDDVFYYFEKLKSFDQIDQTRILNTLKLYQYKVKNQKKYINKLENKVEELKYQPGGLEYQKAKQNFEKLQS